MNKIPILIVAILTYYASPNFGQNKLELLGNISESISYNVKNNVKAKGLDFTIRYFENWLVSSGDRPNIPIKFETIISNVAFTCFVQILDLQSTIGEKDKKIVYEDLIDEFKGKAGMYLEKVVQDIEIDGIAGIKYIWSQKLKRIDKEYYLKCCNYAIIYKRYLITIVYKIGGNTDSIAQVDQVFRNNLNLIDNLTGMFVLDSKYK